MKIDLKSKKFLKKPADELLSQKHYESRRQNRVSGLKIRSQRNDTVPFLGRKRISSKVFLVAGSVRADLVHKQGLLPLATGPGGVFNAGGLGVLAHFKSACNRQFGQRSTWHRSLLPTTPQITSTRGYRC